MRSIGIKDAGFAALDIFTAHHKDGYKMNAIAMGTLRRGSTDAIGCINAKLMRLDTPFFPHWMGDLVRGPGQCVQNFCPRRLFDGAVCHGFKQLSIVINIFTGILNNAGTSPSSLHVHLMSGS